MHIIESKIFTHRRHIDAAMNAIKPGICSIYCQSYDKEMIYEYLKEIKYKDTRKKTVNLDIEAGVREPKKVKIDAK